MIYLAHLALAMAMMQQPEMVCHDAVITAITLKGADDGDHQPVQICELAKAEEPVDVPAHMTKVKHGFIVVKPCDPPVGKDSNMMCGDRATYDKPDCDFDPSRYLLGPNGKGEYICHRSQP